MKNKKLVYIGAGPDFQIHTYVNKYITDHPEEDVIQVIIQQVANEPNLFTSWVLVSW